MVVGIAASFTAQPIEAPLGAALLDTGFRDPDIRFADYNQLHQACLDPSGAFGTDAQYIALLWRIEDVFERQLASFRIGNDTAGTDILEGVRELASLVQHLDASSQASVAASIPPHPASWGIDLLDNATTTRLGRLHRDALAVWVDALSAVPSVEVLDLEALQRHLGEVAIFDPQKWALYRQPYGSAYWLALADQMCRLVGRRHMVMPKCIVLDCDDTLWGGILGEEGPGGIELSDDFPGRTFRDFQRNLKELESRGVLLAIASKNDEADVLDVFERHRGMELSGSDIAAWRVNWSPKSENVLSIAEELNIGVESIVFVDDNPVELEEVGTGVPGVRCLLVPEDLAALPSLLSDSGLFRGMRASTEDLRRTEMTHAETRRRSHGDAVDRAEFLSSLELTVVVMSVDEELVHRAAQLTQKTNQFNLTTIRHNEKQIRHLVSSPVHHVYAISVTDRFGEYGIVGVCIVNVDADEWTIDTFLLSCRVLGRGVEAAFLAAICKEADRLGARSVIGRYEATRKNSQVAEFYPSHGFRPVDGPLGRFRLSLPGPLPAPPEHITLVRRIPT